MLREITLLEEKDRNPKVSVNEANQQQKGRFTVPKKQAWYYAYNHDVNDKGWGCAWRAIQTLLSTTEVQLGFAQMFETFSRKELLIKTLKEHRNPSEDLLKILIEHKWAPEELGNNWAEPFIGSLVSWYHKLPNQLILVNKYPQGMAHAPQGVFYRIVPFKQFSQLIKSNIERTIFMIDDGNYALSIVGYSEPDPNFIELLFADPHISSNKQHRDVGLYAIRFNLEGEPQGQTRNQHQIKQSSHSVFDKLTFKDKPWMVCYLK